MPLEKILEALEIETERQIAEIEQDTQAKIEKIRAQAQVEAVAVRQKHLATIQAPLRAEQARILNRARQEALQLVMNAREAIISSALEKTAQWLASLPTTELYPGLLRQLTQEAVERLGGNSELCLHVQKRDVELMKWIVQEMGLRATVEGNLDSKDEPSDPASSGSWGCLGGLVATPIPDRSISLINTLEARLQRVAILYRSQIAEMVFGKRQED